MMRSEIVALLDIKWRYDQAGVWRDDVEREAANIRWVTRVVETLLRAELARLEETKVS
jgi:hypothetical protein